MKYAVVCYAIHEQAIASFDVFATDEEAKKFIREDATNTYEEEIANGCGEGNVAIEILGNDTVAKVVGCEGEYVWTWEIAIIS